MIDTRKRLTALAWLAALASASGGCIFDRADHPGACARDADCGSGEYCYEGLCIPGSGGAGTGGGAGSDLDAGGSGTTGGHGGDGGAGVGATGGASGSGGAAAMDGGGGSGATDAATDIDADVDASQPLDGQVTVAPYAACASSGDCNPGETCRLDNGAQGVCAAPCGVATDCSAPTGGEATATCTNSQCRLDCSTKVGGGPPMAKMCPSGMTCVIEPADPAWLPGTPTCYPN